MSQPAYPDRVTPVAPLPEPKDEGEITVLRLIRVALSHIRLIFGLGLLLALITGIAAFSAGHSYAADASFIAQGARTPSQANALAAQFGLGGVTSEGSESPQFYVDLVKSREILRGVVRGPFTVRTEKGVVSGDLIKILDLQGKTPAAREANAMQTLSSMVAPSISAKTGVIKLTAVSGYPDLSAQVVTRFIEQINKFNLEGRQLRASAERKFTEDRLSEAAAALADAENRLEEFLRTNRALGSPSLTLQQERLTRAVTMRQAIYTALAQADEQARIEEVRDTPAITVIEPPEPALVPLPRGAATRTIKSFIFGSLLGLLLAFLLDFLQRTDSESETIQALKNLSRNRFRAPSKRQASAR